MRKKQLSFTTPPAGYYRLVVKFKNLLRWADSLLVTGKFWEFTLKQQQRVVAKLRALYAKLAAVNHPLALKVAGAATCFLLFAGTAGAQTASFNKLTGAASPINFTELANIGTDATFNDGVFADIDGDGDSDLCLLLHYTKIAYIQNNNGQFTENDADNPFTNVTPDGLVYLDIVDIDNDGALDLVAINYSDSHGSGNEITHYELNAASGKFELVPDSDINANKKYAIKPYDLYSTIKFFDVNTDGLPDMVCSAFIGSNYMGTFYQNADHSFGDFQENIPIQASQIPTEQYQMAVADMDRDGDDDLTIYAPYVDGYCSYFANNGNGTFTQITETANIPLPLSQLSQNSIMILGDINSDGQMDIFQPGDQQQAVFYNNQAVFLNTTIPAPVAVNEYRDLYFDNYPYTVTPAMLLANDVINHTQGELVAKFISSTNGGVITANGINYFDTLTVEKAHIVKYRVGNALAPGDTVWGNTIESSIFPFPMQFAMVSDSTGDLSVKLGFKSSINYSAIAKYGNNTLILASTGEKAELPKYNLPNYSAGDTVKIYGYGIIYLYADSIKLNYLDVTRIPNLISLRCIGNNLTYLDVSKSNNISKLSCSYNLLDSILLPPNGNGMELDFIYNRLKTLTLPNSTGYLNISHNLLDTLDVSNASGLVYLLCSSNNLKQLKLGIHEELEGLLCDNNQLTQLKLNGTPNLMMLDCQNNQLYELDVDNKPNLFHLNCQNNQFTIGRLPINRSQYAYNPEIGFGGYNYAPQAPFRMHINEYNQVDLYYEFVRRDASDALHYTEFTWITTAGDTLVEGTDYFNNHGNFTFFANLTDSIYCTLYNTAYPQLHGDSVMRTVNIMPQAPQLTNTMVSAASGNLEFYFRDYAGEFFIDYGQGLQQVLSERPMKKSSGNSKAAPEKVSFYDTCRITNYVAGTPIKIFGPGIGRLNVEGLSLTELNVTHLPELNNLYCNNNQLTQLDISHNPNLCILDCRDNKLNFETLPWEGYIDDTHFKGESVDNYNYAPQANIETVANNGQVDLSNQFICYDADTVLYATTYAWFTKDGSPLSSDYFIESNGQFRFTQTPADSVYCVLANAAYPAFTGDSALRTQLLKIESHRPVIETMPQISVNEDLQATLYLNTFSINYYNQSNLELQILDGDNYTHNGTTIIPANNFNGILPVNIMVVDGEVQSEVTVFNLTVNPVNDAPVLTAVTNKTINEDESIAISLDDVTASDIDSNNLTLVVLGGNNYSVSQNVVTPLAGYYGQLLAPVYVTDGEFNTDTLVIDITVTPVPTTPELAWETPASAIYGNPAGNALMNASTTATGTITYSFTADSIFNAGTHTLTAYFTPTVANDFNAVTKTVEYNVTKAALTATADNKTKVYGSANPELTVAYAGFVNGDDATDLDEAVVAATEATTESNAGTYAINLNSVTDNNYTVTTVAGELTITKAALTATADNKTKVYGSANPELTVAYAGFVNGDDAAVLDEAVVATTEATAESNAGTYAINLNSVTDNNYTVTTVAGELAVTKATITATAENKTKVYGSANPELTVAYAGFVNGDDAAVLDEAVVATTEATATSNAGTYAITLNSVTDNNYEVATVAGELTVTKAELTATANNQTIQLGSAIPELTVVYAGFVNNDTDEVIDTKPVATTTATAESAVGEYEITVAGGADNNYSFVYVAGKLTITAKQVPVITWAAPEALVYGTALSATQLNAVAKVADVVVEGTYEYSPAIGTVLNAGSAQVLSVTFTPADAETYETATASVNIDVTKAELTATAASFTIELGSAIPELTVAYAGFVNNDTYEVIDTKPVATTTATAESAAGDYEITVAGGADNNYSFTYVAGKLTITNKKIPVITWATPDTIAYGTALSATQLNAVAKVADVVVEGTYEYSPAIGTVLNAGNAQVLSVTFTPADAETYETATASVNIDVTKAELTAIAASFTIELGSAIPELTVAYTGFVNNDTETVLDTKPVATTTATAESPAGEYEITVAGGADNNYSFVYVAGKLTITPKTVKPELNVSVTELKVEALEASTASFEITANIDWTVTVSETWLTASAANGNGNSQITLTAAANKTTSKRVATVTVAGNGVQSKTITVTQDAGVGIDDNNAVSFSVYPNPATNNINVSIANGHSDGTVEVFNIAGVKVCQQPLTGIITNINVAKMPQGLYIIKVLAGGHTAVSRFVKN